MPYKDPADDKARRLKRRREMRMIIDQAKSCPCVDCKTQFSLLAMQFDHVRGKKKFNIAAALARCSSIENLKKEIAKCEVVCANCHLVRTAHKTTGQFKRLQVEGTAEVAN